MVVRHRRRSATLRVLVPLLAGVVLVTTVVVGGRGEAALVQGDSDPQVLVGEDDDNTANPVIQPAGVAVDQSLANTDVLDGRGGTDVLIGLLGSDVLSAGAGKDIMIGGTEQGTRPNSDVMLGNSGSDVNIWAPGDGSDAFVGASGKDAQILGVIDRDAANVPTLTGTAPGYPDGVPTADLTGSGGFCTLETVDDPTLGYEFLVRFFGRASGALAVTIRLEDVEEVFCTSQAGGQITFADLTEDDPDFEVVTLDEAADENPLVGHIIR